MKFGVCGGPDIAIIAKETGYDYFEMSVGELLRPLDDEHTFEMIYAKVQAVGLPCLASNAFIPPTLKITGPNINRPALLRFAATAFRRAEKVGIRFIVFGSGGARAIPDGFDPNLAWQQVIEFCQMVAPIAQQHGVTLVVEPLNHNETNMITTVAAGAKLVKEVNHPNIRLLVDGYHWAIEEDRQEDLLTSADLIVHAHVATVDGRRPPRPGDDCAPFFQALREAGYHGRVSIEANITDPATELPLALATMRALSA